MKKNLITLLLYILQISSSYSYDIGKGLKDNQDALVARAHLIINAKSEILVEYFITQDDFITFSALSLLEDAANRGVKVNILVDDMGNNIPLPYIRHLQNHPLIDFRVYHEFDLIHPIRTTFKRLHDKLLLVDGDKLITGGRNVSNKYFGIGPKKKNFNDLDILIKGDNAPNNARNYFYSLWDSNSVTYPHLYQYSDYNLEVYCPMVEDDLDSIYLDDFDCEDGKEKSLNEISLAKNHLASLLQEMNNKDLYQKYIEENDIFKDAKELKSSLFLFDHPLRKKSENGIATQLVNILENELFRSNECVKNCEILIISPYVVLSEETKDLIKKVSERNVKMTILTNSLKSSDNLLAQAAYIHESSKGFLKKYGVKIWEYNGKGTLHAKAAIINGKSIIVGTYNLDPRSQDLNREIALFIQEKDGKSLVSDFNKIVSELKKESYLVGTQEEKSARESFSTTKKLIIEFLKYLSPFLKSQI